MKLETAMAVSRLSELKGSGENLLAGGPGSGPQKGVDRVTKETGREPWSITRPAGQDKRDVSKTAKSFGYQKSQGGKYLVHKSGHLISVDKNGGWTHIGRSGGGAYGHGAKDLNTHLENIHKVYPNRGMNAGGPGSGPQGGGSDKERFRNETAQKVVEDHGFKSRPSKSNDNGNNRFTHPRTGHEVLVHRATGHWLHVGKDGHELANGTNNVSLNKHLGSGKIAAGSKASGKYPKGMKATTMKGMHKVLQVRGWKSKGGMYSHADMPGHSVSIDQNGSYTYKHPKGSSSGHRIDELKVCMDKMSGKKY